MKNEIIHHLKKKFDSIMQSIPDFNVEFWYARDLQEHLGYAQWRNFLEVIEKAKVSCMNSGAEVANHFADVGKMVKIGSGAERSIENIMLTRYACYLIAQNGDPRKESIAFAQTYKTGTTEKTILATKTHEVTRRKKHSNSRPFAYLRGWKGIGGDEGIIDILLSRISLCC